MLDKSAHFLGVLLYLHRVARHEGPGHSDGIPEEEPLVQHLAARERRDRSIPGEAEQGNAVERTRSATGGAFLGFLPNETTFPWVKKELAEHARHGLTPTTREEVDHLIAQTRRRGFARTSEFIPGIGGIAAPVFDHTGAMTLALVALGYSKPFDAAFDAISAAVLRKAEQLSRRLGLRPQS